MRTPQRSPSFRLDRDGDRSAHVPEPHAGPPRSFRKCACSDTSVLGADYKETNLSAC